MAVLSEKEKQELALKLALRNTLAKKAMGQPEQIGPTQAKANAIEAQQTVTNNSGGPALQENNNIVDALAHAGKSGWNNITHDATSGLLNIGEKATDFVGADKANDVITNLLRQTAADKAADQEKINEQYGQFGGVADTVNEVATAGVSMLPQIGAFLLTPSGKVKAGTTAMKWLAKGLQAAPSTAVLGVNSMGSGINKALNEGAELEDAQDYGMLNAGKEIITGLPFAGVKYLPGLKNVGQTVAGKVANETAKKIAGNAANMATEGAEEAVAEIIDPFLQKATYNENAKLDWNDVIHSAMIGALTTGAINASGTAVEKGVNALPNAQKVQQKDQNRAFEALHGQKIGQKMTDSPETAQNRPEQAQDIPTNENPQTVENEAQNQTSKADFEQKPVENIQNQKTVENAPKDTLEMADRTIHNVGNVKVKAYQQEHPEIKPYQQAVAQELLADLQMGEKGRREVTKDPDTGRVIKIDGIKRNQSSPIVAMREAGLSYKDITDGLERIIRDNGDENRANAKKVELFVHDAMQNGYDSIVNGRMETNRNYAISKMSMEELEAEAQRLSSKLVAENTDEQNQLITDQLGAIDKRMEQLRNTATTSEMETVATTRNNGAVGYEKTPTNEESSEAGERDRYQELIDEYGPMEKGENPYGENRNIEVPKQTNDFDKTRGFVKTGMESEQTADETVDILKDKIADDYQDGSVTYEPISNEATLNDANIRINQNGWEKEARYFSDAISKGTRITAEDIAVAERCIQEAQKAGNYEAAANIISDLSIVGTEYGQAIQALSMLKRLSPEGQLKTLLKVQDRINNQLIARGQKPVMNITPEVQAEFLAAKDNAERDAIWNREITKAASQTSGTWREKINALRYAAMLSNPKTHIRNLIGNFVMQAAYVPRNIISGALQDIKGGEKTHSLKATFKNTTGNTGKELRDYAQYDLKEYAERSLHNIGNRYDDVSGEFESQRRTFGDSAVGRGLEQVAGKGKYSVGSMLDKEDMLFKRLTYKNALMDYMKANGISVDDAYNGVTKPNGANIAKGREYAMEQARKATFTEDNIAAEWLSEGERKLGVAGAITIGSIMPFKKTPLNILSRGIEFSPVGAGMTAYKLYHAVSGKKGLNGSYYDMNDVMDSIGANLTGSGILALGMYLASEGLLVTTGDDDEERKARYDSQMGDQNFAVVNPETGESWTIDWLAPAAMPLLTGVEVYRQIFGDKDDVDDNTFNKALESASKIADPVFEMSCMQGVASALASYSGDAGDIASSLGANITTGIAGQFVPQPMAALARTIDDTVRSSYAPKDSNVILGKTMESFLRQQRSKIPVASQQNEPSIDVWGNERKREFAGNETEQVIKRALNNMLNPTTYSTDKRTELDKELEKLYEKTGNAGVLPKAETNYVTVDGKTYQKTPEEKTAYDKTKGQKSQKYVSDFVKSKAYKSMNSTAKAKIVGELYNLANYEARKEMLHNRGIKSYSDPDYEKVLASKMEPATYYVLNNTLNGYTGDGKKARKQSYLQDQKKAGTINDEQYWYLYMTNAANNNPSKKDLADCPYDWITAKYK